MRGFSCHLYHKEDRGYVQHRRTLCYNGIRDYKEGSTIYISHFHEKETEQYQELITEVVNEITPCRVIERDKVIFATTYDVVKGTYTTTANSIPLKFGVENIDKLIEFKLLKTYAQSLVLLSFIRNLWHDPSRGGYSVRFFEILETLEGDTLERLTTANKEAVKEFQMIYSVGHCNIFDNLVVRKTEELLKYEGRFVRDFMRES